MGLLEREELAASYFTLTGSPLGQPPRHSLAERAAAARDAGFSALALAPEELTHADVGELRRVTGEHGLRVTELEPLRGWDGEGPDAEAALAAEQRMYEMADALGARQINAIRVVGPEVADDVVAARFAAVCERAAAHGVKVAFEPRSSSPVSTPAGALALLEAAGAANTGIVLDAFHVHRAGVTLDDLAAIPAGLIASIQLNDMRAEPQGSPVEDALEHRLAPGEGVIDLPAWLAGLDAMGVDVPLAVEVLDRQFHAIPVQEAAGRAAAGARRAIAAARALR